MMRDRVRGLIAFHASLTPTTYGMGEPQRTEQVVLAETDFEPSSDESPTPAIPE